MTAHDGNDAARRRLPAPVARLVAAFDAHPIVGVVVVAALVRILFAVGSTALTGRNVIPDEGLYIELGRQIVGGVKPDEWYPGYGQSFYDSLWAFTAPLVALFKIFGPHAIVGRLFAAVLGAATAGVTTAIALRFLRRPFAVAAGLVVALAPSQVLFSSVVLRESEVWLCLVLVALGAVLLMGTDWRRLGAGALLAAVGLLALGWLRDQTMLAAGWALVLALVFAPRPRWLPRLAAGLVLALAIPWLAGASPGGYTLVTARLKTAEVDRQTLAQSARSAFGPTATPGAGQVAAPPQAPAAQPAPQPQGTITKRSLRATDAEAAVQASISHLPAGLVDVMLRPFPWQKTTGLSLALAKVETLVWYVLYVLTGIGVVVALRRRSWRLPLQFPVFVGALMAGIAAITEGNLGTAFRHRDQLLWILALCSAAGLQWLLLESPWARRRRGEREAADAADRDDATPAPAAEHALSR